RDARSLLAGSSVSEIVLALVEGVQQRHALEKVGRLEITKQRLLAEPSVAPALAPSAEPVISQVESVGSPRCRDELEDRERHAPRVHLLEDDADGLLRRLPLQADDWERVASERLDAMRSKLHESRELLGRMHHGADRKRPRDADQQRLNVLVVPDPPTLEVRQLELALHDLR